MLFSEYGDLLNLKDLCEILNVKPATAAKLCKNGQIRAFKAGREWRISRLALENYVLSSGGSLDNG